jgi:hypothetical protein
VQNLPLFSVPPAGFSKPGKPSTGGGRTNLLAEVSFLIAEVSFFRSAAADTCCGAFLPFVNIR